ncbi:GNAT family N-acetyltransferase [Micromonospora sp. HNM0581]|uniref:GNAT family N-acetyltransferase n=1 Tax=Micromonospora sp. HNM0581 TaxID=2716341 RepID=UPI00146C56C7|nr:GNAT family N-acetyltransferase [Micromonospora sp. HNM0581]NLU79504.1 GNAT family N-acetyltransferase [Micromonospora sp. HNM0581]
MTDLDVSTLRAAYDTQLRPGLPDPVPDGVVVESDGPVFRVLGLDQRGLVTYRDLGRSAGVDLDELIARQVAVSRERGEPVEWKLHGHDEPADLPQRLRVAGFVPEEQETVVIGPVAPLASALPVVPGGVRLREVTGRADLDRIAELKTQVWGRDLSGLADALEREIAADPQAVTVVVAEAGESMVSAGWVRYPVDSTFATLWGGSTLPEWRRKGIYRAMVTYRARLAGARGRTLVQVDASDESRPVLERLGLVAVTATTPYVYTP